MKIPDATRVLEKIAAADQRTVGEADILFWAEVLPDFIELEDALKGVSIYYRTHRERLMPSDLIVAARQARCNRTGERMWTE
jgi:hypothetical protein